MLFTGPKGGVNEFGGFDGNLYQGTMWRWKGTDWIKLHPAMVPYARSSAAVGLDTLLNQVVMFGGLADVNPVNTWTYDGASWTMRSVNQPPWVYSSSAAFDPNLKKIILFGGGSGGVDQNSTWAWNGSHWNQVFPMHSATPREGAGMVYDPGLGHIIVFGGQNGNLLLNDTWKFVP
jgi:hypothetical protein